MKGDKAKTVKKAVKDAVKNAEGVAFKDLTGDSLIAPVDVFNFRNHLLAIQDLKRKLTFQNQFLQTHHATKAVLDEQHIQLLKQFRDAEPGDKINYKMGLVNTDKERVECRTSIYAAKLTLEQLQSQLDAKLIDLYGVCSKNKAKFDALKNANDVFVKKLTKEISMWLK